MTGYARRRPGRPAGEWMTPERERMLAEQRAHTDPNEPEEITPCPRCRGDWHALARPGCPGA